MKKYTVPTLLCAGLLLISMLVRALLESPAFVPYFRYFMWVHVVIIALGFYGFWVQRKAAGACFGGLRVFLHGLPIWLAILAVPVAFSSATLFSMSTFSLGTTPEGQPVHHKSWVEENGKHFVVLNRTVKVEITEADHLAWNRESFVVFSSVWILFSYLLLVLWHYNRRREGLANAV